MAFGMLANRRQVIRTPVNEMDKCTIFSIYPEPIDEHNPTIFPGRFKIPAGTIKEPARLVVGTSSWWREMGEGQPDLEIPVSSVLVADSIVNDYCNSVLGFKKNQAQPGLFFQQGEVELDKINKTALKTVETWQRNWFIELVRMADILWARTNGNPIAISDTMRLAAREIGQDSKEWLKDMNHIQLVRCYSCGSFRNPDFPTCGTCKAIDPNHPRAKELKFAVVGG